MVSQFKATVVGIVLVISMLPVSALAADQAKPAPPAPIPAQILEAKKVFVANAGGDDPSPDDPELSGDPDRAYNQFYAAMKTWGRYELVSAPADADLWFEIRFTMPPATRAVFKGDTVGTAPFDPQVRLVIRDPKTNAILWGFTEHVAWAILKGNRDKNFDLALARIVSDVQRLAQQSADGSRK
jgi:hypothetical protein